MFTERLNLKQTKYPLDDQPIWLNDTRNTIYSEQRHKVHTKVSCAEYISSCSMFWGIQEVESGEWIGTISAHIDDFNEVADIGILIHYIHTGKGYGLEAWKAICEFLLKQKGIRKIEAGCMSENIQMMKLCEKTGMYKEGERKGHFLFNDRPTGLVMYGKFRR